MIGPGGWIFRRCDLLRTYAAEVEQRSGQVHIYVPVTGLHIAGVLESGKLVGEYWFSDSPTMRASDVSADRAPVELDVVGAGTAAEMIKGRPAGFANFETWEFSRKESQL